VGDVVRSASRGSAWVRRLRWAHLVAEAVALTLRYRLRGGTRGLPPAEARPARRPAGRLSRPSLSTAVWAVQLATSIWPFRTTCLVRSLVLARILRRRGYPAEVVIGVPEEGVGADPRFAHAWVEVRDGPGSPGYSELVRLVP
jgi:hypothetical protein